jgi:hypothetical protein
MASFNSLHTTHSALKKTTTTEAATAHLFDAVVVRGINQKHHGVCLLAVPFPKVPRCLMATQIERSDFHIANLKVLLLGALSRYKRLHFVRLQPVRQRCLAGIVQSEQNDRALLVQKAQRAQHTLQSGEKQYPTQRENHASLCIRDHRS